MGTPPLKKFKKGAMLATIQLQGNEYLYSVWHPRKGFIASGWRKSEPEAIRAAKLVLNAR